MGLTSDVATGRVIAERYRIDERIGRGGMGAVYRAWQLGVERPVALKLIREEYAGEEKIVKRFLREMRATARVEHANTIRLYDFGQDGRELYIAMELIEGRTLSREVHRGGAMEPRRAFRIAAQIARGLAAAHAEGIIHRDLKPQNVMLLDRYEERDVVKVLDFGIARFSDPDDDAERERLTTSGMIMGTPEFLAPEMVTPGPLDHRSDLYSLGVVLYYMLTTRLPFEDKAAVTVMFRHVHEAPAPPSVHAPVPDWADALVLRLLAKKPEDRFDGGNDAADALEEAVELADALAGADTRDGARGARARRPSEVPTLVLTEPLVPPPEERTGLRGAWLLFAAAALGALLTVLLVMAGLWATR